MKNTKENNFSLCLDQGNSSTKAGVFAGDNLVEVIQYPNADKNAVSEILNKYNIVDCIMSSVIESDKELLLTLSKRTSRFIQLDETTLTPIKNLYKTPETLGKDRLAAAVGANFLQPDKNILVIDAGTAITYDFIDSDAQFHGGNIAPGIDMRLKSLHQFTGKLPLVEADRNYDFLGDDTNSAILSGVMYGVESEINGYINTLKIKYPELLTFLTGGSSFYFEEKFKSAIFVEKNLVLIGLNRLLRQNVQK